MLRLFIAYIRNYTAKHVASQAYKYEDESH
jgi:hypothetical protein